MYAKLDADALSRIPYHTSSRPPVFNPNAPVDLIVLTRRDGPPDECERPVAVSSLALAETVLRGMATSAPSGVAADRVLVQVKFEGMTGTIDLTWPLYRQHAVEADLRGALRALASKLERADR